MRAVITAGARIGGAYAASAGTSIKALARVRGSTMLSRAIAAAREGGAREIAVVGGTDVRTECEGLVERVVSESDDGSENVTRALAAWHDDEQLLYMTSDLPYVTGRSVAEFVRRANGALAMPLTSHAAFVRRFPGAPPFGVRLGRQRIVNGGAFSIPSGAVALVSRFGGRFFEARKRPWSMARLAGLDLLIRFAAGTLSVSDVERRAQKVLGIDVKAVADCPPELAYDADGEAEYRYALEHP